MSTSSTSIAASKKSGLGVLYSLFCNAAHLLRSPFLLFVRLYWGWQFMQTGWGKLHHLSHVRDFFASLGIPLPGLMAPAIASLEFFGGILLIVGLGTRLIGLLLAGNMFVAYLTSERMALTSIFSDPGKFYVADPFTFLFASLIAFIFGAGLFSLDALITRRSQINV
ncbi:MAG: DoxX family protein [Silvibacterium sp.]|jgi:putative oxidoreductase